MMERSAVAVVRATGDDFGRKASRAKSSVNNTAPTKKKYRATGISGSLPSADHADPFLNWKGRDLFRAGAANDEFTASLRTIPIALTWMWLELDATGREQRAFRLGGVNVDEANMHSGKRLAALPIDGVPNQTRAIGQMAAVRAVEGAGNLDIPDRVIIGIAQREGNERVRS